LTFDFSGRNRVVPINIDQIILFLDFKERTRNNLVIYNITFSANRLQLYQQLLQNSTVAATNVHLFINILITVDTWRADWGQSGNVLSDIQVAEILKSSQI
jgi:hypothetical protein